jgi:hypothetical protein
MTLQLVRLLADSAAALGNLTATELALATFELAIDVATLALVRATLRSPRQAGEAAADLDEAA